MTHIHGGGFDRADTAAQSFEFGGPRAQIDPAPGKSRRPEDARHQKPIQAAALGFGCVVAYDRSRNCVSARKGANDSLKNAGAVAKAVQIQQPGLGPYPQKRS